MQQDKLKTKPGAQNEADELIKLFGGLINTKKDSQYKVNIKQYASLSVPSNQMQPYLLAYPTNVQDISIMLKVAQILGKKVVARSGGHHYCGLSLGGQETIVLSMDRFNILELHQNGIIQIGSCVTLIELSKKLKEWGIFVAHGECPLVNVGGLGQTGGYGSFLRSFGLFIDFIQAFEIVLANGEFKRINRPSISSVISNEDQRFNLQLFRGVLGGNAGSFGIVTTYFVKGYKQQNYSQSYGFSKVRLFTKDLFRQLLIVQKQWTEIIAKQEDTQKLRGLDFSFGVGSIQIQSLKIQGPTIIIDGVYGDPDKGVPYNNKFKQILDICSKDQTQIEKEMNNMVGSWQGYYPLTDLSCKNIHQLPQITQSGRETSMPYNRRCNITMTPLTNQCIDSFITVFDNMIHHKDQSIYFEAYFLPAGGTYREKGRITVDGLTITSIPQRNFVHAFMFDVWYEPKAINKLIQIQQKLQQIVSNDYNTPSLGDKKMFWACFGDLDMTKQQVINNYYDSIEQYEQLQKLKQKVDPNDLFHTTMTVKLPNK